MDGIRVSGIPDCLTLEDIKIYFSYSGNGGGRITKIYFPLLNNDAVILFQNAEVINRLLSRGHCIDGHDVDLVRTNAMIFSEVSAKLNPEMSSVVALSKRSKERLIYLIEVRVDENPDDNCIVITGDMYQIEMAWNAINKNLKSRNKIYTKSNQTKESTDGDPEKTKQIKDVNLDSFSYKRGAQTSKNSQKKESQEKDPCNSHSHRKQSTETSRLKVKIQPSDTGTDIKSINIAAQVAIQPTHLSSDYENISDADKKVVIGGRKYLVNDTNHQVECPICFEKIRIPKVLDKCSHKFCQKCIERHFASGKPICPTCGTFYGVMKGDQPLATMSYKIEKSLKIPGFEDADGAIVIQYEVPSGIQLRIHPNPGKRYKALKRTAYLPNNKEGQQIYKMLKKAFENKLIFTIGTSRTMGTEDDVIWNDIHHKTSVDGGPIKFGYPDSTYLSRVREELAAKGIIS